MRYEESGAVEGAELYAMNEGVNGEKNAIVKNWLSYRVTSLYTNTRYYSDVLSQPIPFLRYTPTFDSTAFDTSFYSQSHSSKSRTISHYIATIFHSLAFTLVSHPRVNHDQLTIDEYLFTISKVYR